MKHIPRFLLGTIPLIALITIACALPGCGREKVTVSSTPNQALIDKLKAAADSIVQNTQVPGVVALVVDRTRGIDWMYCAGKSDLATGQLMNPDYTFRIGSNTKTMTGTVLLQLVDEGLLRLEDTLSRYYPAYPKADSITIKMLCNMTSGYFNYSDTDTFQHAMFASPTRIWQPAELVAIGLAHAPYSPPGAEFHYSNTNTIVLGMLVEKLTGNSLESEINRRIYRRLDFSNTGFLNSGTALPGRHARGYYQGAYAAGEDLTEHYDASWGWAAGSAYSTPRELQRYVETLVGGGFLSAALQQRRLSDQFAITPTIGYGLCLMHRGSFYGHNGGHPGFTSSMYHSVEKNCTVIIYYNSQLPSVPDQLFYRFADILYGASY